MYHGGNVERIRSMQCHHINGRFPGMSSTIGVAMISQNSGPLESDGFPVQLPSWGISTFIVQMSNNIRTNLPI